LPYKENGLAAQYSFEGNLNDSNAQFDSGIITGNRIDNTGGTISYADGVNGGKAAKFDGASGIRLPNGLISSDSYSVSLWIKPEQLTQYTTTFFGARDSNNWISLLPYGTGNGSTEVWSGSSTWYDASVGSQIKTGEWTHLAFTVDKDAISVYVNGIEKYKGTGFPNIFTTANASFSLGVNWWDSPFKGFMDELKIYDGSLTAEEISKLAQENK